MIEVKYNVPDMSCAHCKRSVEDSLNELSGVEETNADPDSKVVEVAYDEDRIGEDEIKAAIEEAGYTIAA